LGDTFSINNGVKQGDPAAPTLFTLYLTTILKVRSQNMKEGVCIRLRTDRKLFNLAKVKKKVLEKCLGGFLYVDDTAVITFTLK
jgi:hypothetical protein